MWIFLVNFAKLVDHRVTFESNILRFSTYKLLHTQMILLHNPHNNNDALKVSNFKGRREEVKSDGMF